MSDIELICTFYTKVSTPKRKVGLYQNNHVQITKTHSSVKTLAKKKVGSLSKNLYS